ncbi:MAG: hypothetical protein IPH84_19735 [Bacteroidales bacterium]|nr:hypothetical protein [Bacteroidales bacterium]
MHLTLNWLLRHDQLPVTIKPLPAMRTSASGSPAGITLHSSVPKVWLSPALSAGTAGALGGWRQLYFPVSQPCLIPLPGYLYRYAQRYRYGGMSGLAQPPGHHRSAAPSELRLLFSCLYDQLFPFTDLTTSTSGYVTHWFWDFW